MNVPIENISEYIRCSNCATEFNQNSKIFNSRYCLHKLCENCFRSFFVGKVVVYKCKSCNEKGPGHELNDFLLKAQDEILYENDYRLRPLIYTRFMYKRPENFASEKDYDDYLEGIEDLIEKNLGRELSEDFCGPQSKEELNNNLVKRDEELNVLNKLKKQRDPLRIYNSKTNMIQEENLIDVDMTETVMNEINNQTVTYIRLPVYHKNAQIKIIKNEEKKIATGGYNYHEIYTGLSKYALGGLY